ncbi:transposase family protein (plasmid) [Arthrobacter sp. NyZ413]
MQTVDHTHRRPGLTLADRLLATVLHHRLGLPQTAVATLFGVRPETINKRIRDIRGLLEQTDHGIHPAGHRLLHLDDLYTLARTAGITIPDADIPTT